MNYERIIDVVKEELSKESAIREEVIYKKGYAEGYKDAEKKIKLDIDITELSEESYVEGLEDAWETLKFIILNLTSKERLDMFGTQSISNIIKENSALDVMKSLVFDYLMEDEEKSKYEKHEAIGEILDSNLSDEAKKTILGLIDCLGEDIEVKVIKIDD